MLASIPLPPDPVGDLIIVAGYWGVLLAVVCGVVWLVMVAGERAAARRRRRVRRVPMIDFTAAPRRDPAVWATRAEYDRDARAA